MLKPLPSVTAFRVAGTLQKRGSSTLVRAPVHSNERRSTSATNSRYRAIHAMRSPSPLRTALGIHSVATAWTPAVVDLRTLFRIAATLDLAS